MQRSNSIWHPLAVLEPEWLDYDANKLHSPQHGRHPPVLLDNCIYVGGSPSYGSSKGELLKYSLAERSWDIIRTPKEAAEGYVLAMYSNKVVLVGGQSIRDQVRSNKVWVRQGTVWRDDLIPQVPVPARSGVILSAIGHGDLLIVAYKTVTVLLNSITTESRIFCDGWKSPCPGPPLRTQYDRVNIIVHESYLYAITYTYPHNNEILFFRAQFSSTTYKVGEWKQLSNECGCFQSSTPPRFAIFGNKLVIAKIDGPKVVLYTPFIDVNDTLSLVDIGDLNVDFYSVDCIIGHTGTSESLIVMGQAKKTETSIYKSSVVKFNYKGTDYMLSLIHI